MLHPSVLYTLIREVDKFQGGKRKMNYFEDKEIRGCTTSAYDERLLPFNSAQLFE